MIVPSAQSSITALKSVTDTYTDISQIYISSAYALTKGFQHIRDDIVKNRTAEGRRYTTFVVLVKKRDRQT